MNFEIRKKADFKTSVWSGGKTTEFMIYPPEASYKKREFLFRISSAVVRDQTSIFTALPNTRRILLVLDGKLRLECNGHTGNWLHPGDQQSFLGDWDTSSEGMATDYNLMMKGDTSGTIQEITLAPCRKETIQIRPKAGYTCIYCLYCFSGQLIIHSGNERCELGEKDLGVMELPDAAEEFEIVSENTAQQSTRFIKTEVYVPISQQRV